MWRFDGILSAKDKKTKIEDVAKIKAEIAELTRRKDILDSISPKNRRSTKKLTQTRKNDYKKTNLTTGGAVADNIGDGASDTTKTPSVAEKNQTAKKPKSKKTQASKTAKRDAATATTTTTPTTNHSNDSSARSKRTDVLDSTTSGSAIVVDDDNENNQKTTTRSKKTVKKTIAKSTAQKSGKKTTGASAKTKKTATTKKSATTKKTINKSGKTASGTKKKAATDSEPAVAATKPKTTKKRSQAKPDAKKESSTTAKKTKTPKNRSTTPDSKEADVPELTLEEKLESELTEEEIERFQIEKVNMEQLIRKICDILAEHESTGMLQTDLWKKLKLSDMIGSRLSLKLERMGTITREKLLENNRWTYKLVLKKTPISTQSIEDAPCLICPVEQKCTLDGEISPRTCQYIEDWVSSAMKKSRSK